MLGMRLDVRVNQRPLVSIVDDDESVRDSIQSLLRSAGIRAEAYSSAEDLLDAGHLNDTACIVLDIRMPGMDGLQLQRRLANDGYPISVIFVTAHPDENVRRQALEAGALAFLRKPFDPNALLQIVQSALEQAKRK